MSPAGVAPELIVTRIGAKALSSADFCRSMAGAQTGFKRISRRSPARPSAASDRIAGRSYWFRMTRRSLVLGVVTWLPLLTVTLAFGQPLLPTLPVEPAAIALAEPTKKPPAKKSSANKSGTRKAPSNQESRSNKPSAPRQPAAASAQRAKRRTATTPDKQPPTPAASPRDSAAYAVGTIADRALRVQGLLRAARLGNEATLGVCYDDKLNQINATLRVARSYHRLIDRLAEVPRAERQTRHAMVSLNVLVERSGELLVEAQDCLLPADERRQRRKRRSRRQRKETYLFYR